MIRLVKAYFAACGVPVNDTLLKDIQIQVECVLCTQHSISIRVYMHIHACLTCFQCVGGVADSFHLSNNKPLKMLFHSSLHFTSPYILSYPIPSFLKSCCDVVIYKKGYLLYHNNVLTIYQPSTINPARD